MNYRRKTYISISILTKFLTILPVFMGTSCKSSNESHESSTLAETFPISVQAKIQIREDSFEILEPAGFDWEQDSSSNLKREAINSSVVLSSKYCQTKVSSGQYRYKSDGQKISIEKTSSVTEKFNFLSPFQGSLVGEPSGGSSLAGQKFIGPIRLDRGQIGTSRIYIVLSQVTFSGTTLSITYDCKIETKS